MNIAYNMDCMEGMTMTDREKLIELLKSDDCPIILVLGDNMNGLADYLIANGVTVQEWISVKDRLPTREDANETESILAINKDEKYVGRWLWDIVARWPDEFTNWMPLPEPPKGE